MLEELMKSLGYTSLDIEGFKNHDLFAKMDEKDLANAITDFFEIFGIYDLGFSNKDLIKITKKHPKLLLLPSKSLVRHIANLLDRIGYTKEDLKKMVQRFPLLLILTDEYIYQRIGDMAEFGYTEEQVKNITINYPALYALNLDFIRDKDDFYRSIGLEGIFVKSSKSIEWSIELVYARYMFYKSIGINIDMDNCMLLYEEEIYFVKKYEISNSQLMEQYPYPNDSFKKRN